MPGGNSLEANIGRVFDPKEWCQDDLTRRERMTRGEKHKRIIALVHRGRTRA